MDKRTTITLTAIIIPIIAGLVFLTTFDGAKEAASRVGSAQTESKVSKNPVSTSTSSSTPTQKAADTKPAAASARTDVEPGKYVAYSDAALKESKGTTLLFFHAPWCRQCQMIEDDIKAQGVPDGVTVLKVDYDSNNELRKKYEVTLQTTVVKVSSSGQLINSFVAYNEPSFDAVVRELL